MAFTSSNSTLVQGLTLKATPRGHFDKVASVATFIYALRWPQNPEK